MSGPDFTEIVGEPAEGRVYEHELQPGIADAGGDWRVRVDAIARWLQDVAHLDLLDAGFRVPGVRVVRRMRLRADGFPRWNETLTLRTWCSGMGRFTAERRTTVEGESGRVEAAALWVWLDGKSLRPKRFPEGFLDVYGPSAGGRNPSPHLRHADPPDGAGSRPWRFRATDVDVAAHINNSQYWSPIEEEFAGAEFPRTFDAEIEFRDAAQPGEALVVADGAKRWITSPEGKVHASIVLGG